MQRLNENFNKFFSYYSDLPETYDQDKRNKAEYVTLEEAATRLNMGESTVRNWIRRGQSGDGKAFREGVHYVKVRFGRQSHPTYRIVWDAVVRDLFEVFK